MTVEEAIAGYDLEELTRALVAAHGPQETQRALIEAVKATAATYECLWCGKTFVALTKHGPARKYCSDSHRQLAHRRR